MGGRWGLSTSPAEEIVDWFDSHPDATNLPPEVERLRRLTPEDNPVVVIME